MFPPILIVAVSLVAVVALASIRRIPEGQVVSLRRIGGRVRILEAGTHMIVPLVERVAHRIKLAGNRIPFSAQAPESTDAYRGTIFYQVVDPQRADAFIEDAEQWLQTRSGEWLANCATPLSIPEQRQQLKTALNGAAVERGLLVTRVELAAGD